MDHPGRVLSHRLSERGERRYTVVMGGSSLASSLRETEVARAALRACIHAHTSAPLELSLVGRRLGPYRGYGEQLRAIAALADGGARLRIIGRSVRREPIFAVQMGSAAPRAATSVVLSGLRPGEWIGIETALALLGRLSARPGLDRCVYAVPIANPDGTIRVEQALRERRWRLVRANARGVDLCQNFDAHWRHRGLLMRLLGVCGTSGSRPASEPETVAISHALSGKRIDRAISLHGRGGAVLYPYAALRRPTLDREEHRRWATSITRASLGRLRDVAQFAWRGPVRRGSELDWLYERHGALSLLVECPSGPHATLRRIVEPFAWQNPEDPARVSEAIARAIEPFVMG